MALFAVTGAVCLCQGYAQDVFSCFVKQWLLVVNPGRQAMFTDETTQASLSNQCGDVLIWGCCLNVGIIIRLFICSFSHSPNQSNFETASVYLRGTRDLLEVPQHPNFQKPPFEDWLCALLYSNYIKLPYLLMYHCFTIAERCCGIFVTLYVPNFMSCQEEYILVEDFYNHCGYIPMRPNHQVVYHWGFYTLYHRHVAISPFFHWGLSSSGNIVI